MSRNFLILLFTISILGVELGRAESPGLLERIPLTKASMLQWKLPKRLREISGLALTHDGRLLAIEDEEAIIYELDYQDGHIRKAFAVGDPTLKGDYEGIAVADGLVYVTDSDGSVLLFAEGGNGSRVTYEQFDTGLGELCEIEGLATSLDQSRLLFACKALRDKSQLDALTVFAFDIEQRTVVDSESLTLPESEIEELLETGRIAPSGIAVDPTTGNLVLITARKKAIIELTSSGKLLAAREFPARKRHYQPEGIEIPTDNRLLISDEGGKHKGRLAIYGQDEVDSSNE